MKKFICFLAISLMLFSSLCYGEKINTRVTASALSDTPYAVGEIFYEVAKPSILRRDDENAPDITLQRNEYIVCRYLGLLDNTLQIQIVDTTEQAGFNHATSEWEESLAFEKEDERTLLIPLNKQKEGLLRVVREFTVSSSMIKDFDSAPVRQYEKQFLITVVDDFGRIRIEEYE